MDLCVSALEGPAAGEGPVIHNPVRTAQDVAALKPLEPQTSLASVMDRVRQVRRELEGSEVPLIGFAGAPFTLATYLIEGRSPRGLERTKRFMYEEPVAWHQLMQHLVDTAGRYLRAQAAAGRSSLLRR